MANTDQTQQQEQQEPTIGDHLVARLKARIGDLEGDLILQGMQLEMVVRERDMLVQRLQESGAIVDLPDSGSVSA